MLGHYGALPYTDPIPGISNKSSSYYANFSCGKRCPSSMENRYCYKRRLHCGNRIIRFKVCHLADFDFYAYADLQGIDYHKKTYPQYLLLKRKNCKTASYKYEKYRYNSVITYQVKILMILVQKVKMEKIRMEICEISQKCEI